MSNLLERVALASISEPAAAWLDDALPSRDEPLNLASYRAIFATARRRLGESIVSLSNEDFVALSGVGVIAPERWTLDRLGRAALLARALEIVPLDGQVGFVRQMYLRGDFQEQAAILQTLPVLSDPLRFVDIAIDACRTNVLDVFEGIACENGYPAAHFPDLNFNQLVLKAFFMGVAVGRIVGLDDRKTAELSRMTADFASERRAAGRPVPDDMDLAMI